MDFDPKETDMKYCGIDLHSNNSVVIVSDEEDRMVFSKRLPNDLGQIRAALEAHQLRDQKPFDVSRCFG
jgi:hypothetical protein